MIKLTQTKFNSKMARRPFNRDDKVEVKMQEGEFAGGVYGGVITGVWNHRYEVRLTTLTDGGTGGPMKVHVGFSLSATRSTKDLGGI